MVDAVKIKGIVNKAEFEKIKGLKEKITKEKGNFPCCGGLEKKYIDAFLQLLWDDDELKKQVAAKENWHGKIDWFCDTGHRIFYI